MDVLVFPSKTCEWPVQGWKKNEGKNSKDKILLASLSCPSDHPWHSLIGEAVSSENLVFQLSCDRKENSCLPVIAPLRDFYLSEQEANNYLSHAFYHDLIKTRFFTRLKGISFLGAIEYIASLDRVGELRGRQSRYDHSLGVAILASYYTKRRALSVSKAKPIVAAALLHDIGHAPLSHSLEPIFSRYYGLDHHAAAQMRLMGGQYVRHSDTVEIHQVFRKHQVDMDEVALLLSNPQAHPHGRIFFHPINIDTIEGIARSRVYFNGRRSLFSRISVLEALLDPERNSSILDLFWETKNAVYSNLINGHTGLLADEISTKYMISRTSDFRPGDFFLSEPRFRVRHSALFEELRRFRLYLHSIGNAATLRLNTRSIRQRLFSIDRSAMPGDPKRYSQKKILHDEVF